ncbi:hypothetical protein Q31b_49500 [Novipirellula aureliae]|uniref:Uncharacterized protein n=1 Tax=Novipirellula aureliae TaxID=2527966 RepID=A0A5C6DIX2_9BACT|nr:hypothetical protein [Novipirellula aureliae]TWU36668.1 hypothetical protein Q31b_49500 [Novipirellula aureliae]
MQLNICVETNFNDHGTSLPVQDSLSVEKLAPVDIRVPPITGAKPAVEQVLLSILEDSKIMSAQFVVRSNVRHDGE